MYFNSVEQILTQLEQQPGWEKFREYRQLLKCWHAVVNQNTAKHTKPLYISRQVFWIATSSAARAQELSFQRYTLLKRLNQQLPFKLKDIRFSASGWQQKANLEENQPIFKVSHQHKPFSPSYLTVENPKVKDSDKPSPIKAKDAAKRWLKTIEQRNYALVVCPNCNALTTRGEIERWNCCYHCIAQKWSQEYRPPAFPELK